MTKAYCELTAYPHLCTAGASHSTWYLHLMAPKMTSNVCNRCSALLPTPQCTIMASFKPYIQANAETFSSPSRCDRRRINHGEMEAAHIIHHGQQMHYSVRRTLYAVHRQQKVHLQDGQCATVRYRCELILQVNRLLSHFCLRWVAYFRSIIFSNIWPVHNNFNHVITTSIDSTSGLLQVFAVAFLGPEGKAVINTLIR